jgi:hypothetical protein
MIKKLIGRVFCLCIYSLALSGHLWADDPVTWTNVVGASASGNNLTKTAATTAWDAGASSTNVIRDGYGYVEFTATETNTYRMAGLSNGDTNQNYTDIDFGIVVRSDGTCAIFEGGTYRGETGTYSANDRFRVEVFYGVVRYFRNGTLLYTSPATPRYPLLVDTALYQQNATLTNVRVGNLVWTPATNVRIAGQSLTKTASAGWNAGASSTNTVESGDGFAEFIATETNTHRAVGVGNVSLPQALADIQYGIVLRTDGYLEVSESGTSKGTFGAYLTGDVLRVEIQGGTIRYYQNGVVFYTSLGTPTYPVRAESVLDTAGATIGETSLQTLIWTNMLGVSVQGTNLTKTASTGWNAGASSTRTIDNALDGWMEFTALETNTRRVAGLKTTGTASDYTQIDFAIDLGATGNVTIYELGVSKGTYGTYAPGDRFRVEIQNGNIRYRKNGTVLYTSSGVPTYPLHTEASLYTTGATLICVALGVSTLFGLTYRSGNLQRPRFRGTIGSDVGSCVVGRKRVARFVSNGLPQDRQFRRFSAAGDVPASES